MKTLLALRKSRWLFARLPQSITHWAHTMKLSLPCFSLIPVLHCFTWNLTKIPLTKLDPVSVHPIRDEETHSGLILFFPLAPRAQPSPNQLNLPPKTFSHASISPSPPSPSFLNQLPLSPKGLQKSLDRFPCCCFRPFQPSLSSTARGIFQNPHLMICFYPPCQNKSFINTIKCQVITTYILSMWDFLNGIHHANMGSTSSRSYLGRLAKNTNLCIWLKAILGPFLACVVKHLNCVSWKSNKGPAVSDAYFCSFS